MRNAKRKPASGCMVGLAVGDALGAPTEFLSVEAIVRRFPPHGPQELTGRPARVTDDTQMALAVAAALAAVGGAPEPKSLEAALRQEFVAWYRSPENTRAPGITCMDACGKLAAGVVWTKATGAGSKGCGANMRVAPVGLYAAHERLDEETRAAVAQFQAALTHGHPTALAASDLTALAVHDLAIGIRPAELLPRMRDYCHSQREVYHGAWLGPLCERPGVASPAAFIARGWEECLAVLDRLEQALPYAAGLTDPCEATGEGWVAEEALATGLLCFLLSPEEAVAAVRRAACSSGDSDSIASLAGAFAGAYAGLEAWPADWQERIEYREELLGHGERWDEIGDELTKDSP